MNYLSLEGLLPIVKLLRGFHAVVILHILICRMTHKTASLNPVQHLR